MTRDRKRAKAVAKKLAAKAVKSRPKLQKALTKTAPARAKLKAAVKKRKQSMTKKQDDDYHPDKNLPPDKKPAKQESPYGATPEPGSLDPGKTTMANPPPTNVVMPPAEPTDDPMATPEAGPLPNPPSRPGGDFVGEPNVSATGEKLDPDHPDYRKDMEGRHQPDHRSAEEKKENPRE